MCPVCASYNDQCPESVPAGVAAPPAWVLPGTKGEGDSQGGLPPPWLCLGTASLPWGLTVTPKEPILLLQGRDTCTVLSQANPWGPH